jgi:RNA polymerase sigma-70 factor (ECF subfamily)
MHDVFLEAWHSASLYDQQRGTVATWLILRMRSRTLDRLRSAGRTRTVLMEDPLPVTAQISDDPHDSADKMALRDALNDLPPEQRAVLELGYFGGLSSSEIAAKIGISVGTVKSRTAAGLSKLRVRFAADQGSGGER